MLDDIENRYKIYFSSFPPNLKKLTLIPTKIENFNYELVNLIPISKNMIEFNYTTRFDKYCINYFGKFWTPSIDSEFVNIILKKFSTFNNLQILEIEHENLVNEHLKYLPNSLQDLKIIISRCLTSEVFCYLPRNLKFLTIGKNDGDYFFPFNEEESYTKTELILNPYCYTLPKNLKNLKLYPLKEFYITKDQYQYYWQKLLSSEYSNCLENFDNDNILLQNKNEISILDIVPKNIIRLELYYFKNLLKHEDFARLNNKMEYLEIFEIDHISSKLFKYCPRFLRNLHVDCVVNLEDFKYLPEKLKELTIKCIDVNFAKKKLISLVDRKYILNLRSYLE